MNHQLLTVYTVDALILDGFSNMDLYVCDFENVCHIGMTIVI